MSQPSRRPAAALVALALAFALCRCAEAKAPSAADEVGAVLPAVRADYEALHRRPELGKREFETAKRVRARLASMGFTSFEPVKGLPTAVVAVLDSGKRGPTIALRADMDARRGKEQTGLPYASEDGETMHSCGHDAHTAILLGAAQVLSKRKAGLAGRVVFLFQPAEESPGGADEIVADGVLERLGVSAMFALHAMPGLPVGRVQIAPGPVFAGSSYFTARLRGRGSHAATPQAGDDVLASAARVAAELTNFPARHLDALGHPTVVSVAYFQSGEEQTLNVLPGEARFAGTVRSFDDLDAPLDGGPSLRQRLTAFLEAQAKAHDLALDFDLRKGSPPTTNDARLYERLKPRLAAAWPAPVDEQSREMLSEDFSFYTPKHPSLYFSLGVAKEGLGQQPLHTEKFSVHPDALATGVRLLVTLATLAPPALGAPAAR